MGKIKDILKSTFQGAGKKTELPIKFSESAVEVLNYLLLRKNPFLSEFPFLGVGINGIVEEIIVADTETRDSRLIQHTEYQFTSSVDKNELIQVWNKAYLQGKFDQLLLLGHSHPSGETTIEGRRYIVSPSDGFLEPSTGSPNIFSGGDLSFYKAFAEANPHIHIPFSAIATVTPEGPKVKIYTIKELLTIKRVRDLEKISSKTILLRN